MTGLLDGSWCGISPTPAPFFVEAGRDRRVMLTRRCGGDAAGLLRVAPPCSSLGRPTGDVVGEVRVSAVQWRAGP